MIMAMYVPSITKIMAIGRLPTAMIVEMGGLPIAMMMALGGVPLGARGVSASCGWGGTNE